MIIKKSKAVIKKYKTNTIRSTAIPKDIVDLLDIKDKDKLIWIIGKNGNVTIKKESVENVNL